MDRKPMGPEEALHLESLQETAAADYAIEQATMDRATISVELSRKDISEKEKAHLNQLFTQAAN
eukprot:10495929-Heterocapsa_arctica.AAC.1